MSAPQDARTWRGEAAVDADEAAERLTAGRLGGGSRRLLRELLSRQFVHCAKRLVQQKQSGLCGERPGDRCALTHTA